MNSELTYNRLYTALYTFDSSLRFISRSYDPPNEPRNDGASISLNGEVVIIPPPP